MRITQAKLTFEWAPHGANHTAVGRKFLPTEECIAGAHDPMSWDASPQEAEALSENRTARKTKQGADFPPQEVGTAAPGPSTPPFRGVLRGRGGSFKIIGFSRTGRGVLHHTFLNLY